MTAYMKRHLTTKPYKPMPSSVFLTAKPTINLKPTDQVITY